MTSMTDDAAAFTREFLDTGLTGFSQLAKVAQAIAQGAADYTRTSFESGSAAVEKLAAAKSVEAAFEVQADYAKASYERFVAEASKFGGLYTDLAKEAYKPFETAIAKAV